MSFSESTRSLNELSEDELVKFNLDLVTAARRTIGFLRQVVDSHWIHHRPVLVQAIRRYDELWMPLVSDLMVGSMPPMILPPLDIEWVWFCHSLNPVSYRQYCESRFAKLIGKPTIFNEETEDYALNRSREIWMSKYPDEPFENESNSNLKDPIRTNEDLLGEMSKQRCLFTKILRPYMLEIVYLIAAKKRYKRFLYIMQRFADSCSSFVPTSDILLMWLTHKSYPTAYAADVKDMEENTGKVVGEWISVTEEEFEETKKLWERIFDQPYEKAGCPALSGATNVKPPVYWEITDADVNLKYKPLMPRFLLEVNIMVKLNSMITKTLQGDISKEFLRLRVLRCHRELKINTPLSSLPLDKWRKVLHIYCEFGTKGVVVELRGKGGLCLKGSKLREDSTFLWNDLLRAPSITMEKEVDQRVRVITSITAPAQASYLLKCVPDRVTDDSGAMISDVILRMNQYRPQEGRWLSRTVLDLAGRECFVIRMRVGGGFWRRGGDTPSVVKWEERCIEIREGSWSYVAGSIGRAPEKVVGTATPKAPSQGWKASWSFSTGYELFMRWESSKSISSLCFDLINNIATESPVRLLKGRQMQYRVKNLDENMDDDQEIEEGIQEEHDEEGEEEGFVTLVRFSEENPIGKATALLNWKLLVVEFLPEEDAASVLLLCISILRSVSEMRQEDMGSLLTRRRVKEAKHGARDLGSVIVHPSSSCPNSLPYVQPWYWNAKVVMAPEGVDYVTRQPDLSYSAEDGGDQLYKRAIIA